MKVNQEKLSQDYNQIWNSYLEDGNLIQIQNSRLKNRQPYYEILEKHISHFSSPIVLELGCGTGFDINEIYTQNRNIFPYASDILLTSIRVGRKFSKLFRNKIKFFVSDTLCLPVEDNKFDIVFSQGLLEHFKNPIEVVREQARILKEGGFVIINVPQKYTGYTLMKKEKMKKGKWELGWETEFSYNDLKKMGKCVGLKEVGISGYQYWKSWREPAFVLKDLVDKFFRKIPLLRINIFRFIQNMYNDIWHRLELKWGHYFLQNIIIVFQK
jgi:ubiquinone/menaquinone biosynthesis C-methylase UbiE